MLSCTGVIAVSNEKLAFLKYTGDYWQVFVKQGDGQEIKISVSQYDKSAISWLADGNRLFVCGVQGDAEIFNIKTGLSEKVALPKDSINDAVISPDGKTIIYSHIASDSTDNKLWLYDVISKSEVPVLSKMQGRQYDPKWNIAGSAFYFVTGVANTTYSINQATLKDKTSDVVVYNAGYNLDVDVSNSGKLAYSSNVDNSFDIWVKTGKETKQLTTDSGSEARPSWSSNENTVYFEKMIDGVVNIWAVNALDGRQRQVTFSELGARSPVVYKMVVK